MLKAKYGKVIESNTHGDTQEIVIKELNSLVFWKKYHAILGMNYTNTVSCYDVVKFLVDEHSNVIAVKPFGKDLNVQELFELRVK